MHKHTLCVGVCSDTMSLSYLYPMSTSMLHILQCFFFVLKIKIPMSYTCPVSMSMPHSLYLFPFFLKIRLLNYQVKSL